MESLTACWTGGGRDFRNSASGSLVAEVLLVFVMDSAAMRDEQGARMAANKSAASIAFTKPRADEIDPEVGE